MSDHLADPILFETTIRPHRSLSRRLARRIVTAMFAASAASAAIFWLLGAWPVTGFCGAEIALAATLLLLHLRSARVSERVLLCQRRLRVIRTDPRGRRSICDLPSAWLNVRLEERAGTTPRLLVGVRDRELEIGRVLGETERRGLFTALRDALDRQRNPSFANPQLAG